MKIISSNGLNFPGSSLFCNFRTNVGTTKIKGHKHVVEEQHNKIHMYGVGLSTLQAQVPSF